MPAEHYGENGELRQGYYCSTCGESCSLYGHLLSPEKCVLNPDKVALLREANKPNPWHLQPNPVKPCINKTMNDEDFNGIMSGIADVEFYIKCSDILNVEFIDHSFTHYKRTRWNNRSAGNGRFPGFGIIRVFGDKVHVACKLGSFIFNSKEECVTWLEGGMVTSLAS